MVKEFLIMPMGAVMKGASKMEKGMAKEYIQLPRKVKKVKK